MSGYFPSRSWYTPETNTGYTNYSHGNSGWVTDVDADTDAASNYSEDLDTGFDSSPEPGLSQRIRTMFIENVYADAHFEVNCGLKPKPSLKAHRAVLAVGSPVFAEMFLKQKAEGKDIIQINNHPFYAFKAVVEYLYTDEIYFENGKDVEITAIMAAAKDFRVPALEARCLSHLESSEIRESNVCSRLQLANTHKLEQYKQKCLEFIQDNTNAVLFSSDFLSCTSTTLRTICKLPRLHLQSELHLFEGVMRWIKALPNTPSQNKKQLTDSLMRHIRFLNMSGQDFGKLVTTHPNVISKDDAFNILLYHQSNGSHTTLPSWCCKSPNRCSTQRGAGAQQGLIRRPSPTPELKISIPLRPVKGGQVPNLTCLLSLKCTSGSFRIQAVKLSFGSPVTADSVIERLVINVRSAPHAYHFTENLTIRNSSQVVVPFTRPLLARAGNLIHIQTDATEISNYYFQQFDEQNFKQTGSPFEVALSSKPKGNRLFFISEVIYEVLPARPRRGGRGRSQR